MDTKLKCLLLDDELPGLSYLKLLCEQLPELEVVRAFNDPELFLKEIQELDFDLCILDIEMPGINGIEVAKLLGGKPVIFTTAYKDYATDAFDLDAIDYIVKPVKPERLKQAVNKVVQRTKIISKPEEFIRINTDRGNTLLYPDQILYIKTSEIDSRDKIASLENGVSITLKNVSFEKLSTLLPAADFCRINKKEMLALNRLRHFSTDQITTNIYLQREKPLVLTLGDAYRIDFLRKING